MRSYNANFITEKNKRGCAPRNLVEFGWPTPVLLADVDYTGESYASAQSLSQTSRSWSDVAINQSNGDAYACVYNGGIYRRIGSGNFIDLGQATRSWTRIIVNSANGDVFALTEGGVIYKSISGGDFNLYPDFSGCIGITVNPTNGDVSVCNYYGNIYRQPGGVGEFNNLFQTERKWYDIAYSLKTGDYFAISDGNIYRQISGSGNFTSTGASVSGGKYLTTNPHTGDLFVAGENIDIYKWDGINLVGLGCSPRLWSGIAVNQTSGEILVSVAETSGGTPPGDIFEISPVTIPGLIKSWGFIDSAADQVPGRSIVGNFETSDLSLTIINSTSPRFGDNSTTANPIEGIEVTLYQWFKGTALTDKEVIFKGVVTGQPDYDEREYRLTVRGIWSKYNRTIGATALITEAAYPGCDPDDVGKMQNIGYGQLLHVPARAVEAGAVDCVNTTVTSGATTIVLVDASKFLNSGIIGIGDELISYTGKSSNSLTGCTRGINSTTAAAHNAGDGVYQDYSLGYYYVYQLAGHPVKAIRQLYVGSFKVSSVSSVYTGKSGDVHSNYPGQAVAQIPARVTRASAISLLVANGMSSAAATAAVNTVTGSGVLSISDIYELFNIFGINTGSHTHPGSFSSSIIPTSSNSTGNYWTGAISNVRDQSSATSCTFSIMAGGEEGTITCGIPTYTGSNPTAVFACITHRNSGTSGATLAGNALDSSGTVVTQKFYIGTTVPTSLIFRTGSTYYPNITVYEMWIEVSASSTGSSGADGVITTLAASVTRASSKTVPSKGGTVTRSGVCNLSGNSAADVDIGARVNASFDGWQDDASGTITGSANALIERPGHVIKHLLLNYCGFPSGSIGASFATAATWYASNSYAFSLLLNQPVQSDQLLTRLGVQCRSRFLVTPSGEARLLVRSLGQSSAHAIPKNEIRMGSMSVRRSCSDDIVNTFSVKYNPDLLQLGSADCYQSTTNFADSTSVTRYGTREASSADLFNFDAVSSSAMAASVGQFWLDFLKISRRQPNFSVFLDNCEVEPGDIISVTHPLDAMTGFVCEVLKVRNVLGSGRDKRMDCLEILAVEN